MSNALQVTANSGIPYHKKNKKYPEYLTPINLPTIIIIIFILFLNEIRYIKRHQQILLPKCSLTLHHIIKLEGIIDSNIVCARG